MYVEYAIKKLSSNTNLAMRRVVFGLRAIKINLFFVTVTMNI
jgi:hypothetical protein